MMDSQYPEPTRTVNIKNITLFLETNKYLYYLRGGKETLKFQLSLITNTVIQAQLFVIFRD